MERRVKRRNVDRFFNIGTMDIRQIESNIETLLSTYTEENFIYGLLSAYGLPNAAITRLKNGEYNLAKEQGQILWKKRVCFKIEKNVDLHSAIDQLKKTPAVSKQHPRFILVTDFQTLLALDTDNSDTLDIPLQDLSRHFDFFLPWAGMEKSQLQRENPADIKAAERMGRLYDLILEENPIEDEKQRHALNVFFTRILFCYFAEDTGIFPSGIFVNGVASHTADDGSDLQAYLSNLFDILNTPDRKSCPAFLAEYPYVNGGLFATKSAVPRFNAKSRKILIECGSLNWKAINPDIFGSMMQAVVHSDERSGKGMHYTSVVNIMKVIEPLFLNDLREELEKAGDNRQKLEKLLERIYHLRIFDPACGSGNFLIIAYKELCKLEIDIFKRLDPHGQMSFRFRSKLKLSQFYGIEIDDFAHEIAKLSLWLTEHQMNLAFREIFGETRPTLPLQESGNVLCGNATQMDWLQVCPSDSVKETLIIGNPPYSGFKMQTAEQKADLKSFFGSSTKLDYISIWLLKAASYARISNCRFAFVTTASLNQGEQVGLLWPKILDGNLEIFFAHTSFKWSNNARNNAGVACSVVGISPRGERQKIIYSNGISKKVSEINPYLTAGKFYEISKRSEPLSVLPSMTLGDMAKDGGHLFLNREEMQALIEKYPSTERLIRQIWGADEFIQGRHRWCLWITEENLQEAQSIPPVLERIELVKQARLESDKQQTREYSEKPYRFVEIRYQATRKVLIPTVSSEKREYIPITFLESRDVINAPNNAIYDPPVYIFAVISSRMHMAWVRAVAGRLEDRLRYSAMLCYNTFPLPKISELQIRLLEKLTFDTLEEREHHSEKTIAELYDPKTMPPKLRKAHHEIDLAVDALYRTRAFVNDEERLEHLFQLYDLMSSKKDGGKERQCQISLM